MARLPGRPPEPPPAYLEKFERLQAIGAPDDPILAELVAHERRSIASLSWNEKVEAPTCSRVLRAHLDASQRAAPAGGGGGAGA